MGQHASVDNLTIEADQTLRGPATGVQIVVKPRCSRCHATQNNMDMKLSLHRCERCAILQRTAGYMIVYSGVLIMSGRDGAEQSVALTNSAVSLFIRDHFLQSSAHDGPALEETVMGMEELEVTFNAEGLVVCFCKAAAIQSGQGSVPDQEQASTSYASEGESVLDGVAEVFEEDY